MPEGEHAWHWEVLTPALDQTLRGLAETSYMGGFYLGGGTGLALHLGHRRSLDLDFFSNQTFDSDALVQRLQALPGFSVAAKGEGTLHTQVMATKVSFLSYAYPLLFSPGNLLGMGVADPRDIACMKISAIAGRGTRRDFIDLYAVSQQYGLENLLELFKRKFARVNYSVAHVLKSLTYFEDAEKDPMPDLLAPLSWHELREFFIREALRLL